MNEKEGITYAIFGDGSVARILLGRLPHSGGPEPIELVPIGIDDPDIKDSAKVASIAAYSILDKIVELKGKKYCFSYQFDAGGRKIFGKSAGLALALAFVQEIRNLTFDIAATGEISNALPTAKVKGVEKIEAKLKAAIEVLPAGGMVFYPGENQDEVEWELREKARKKGVDLIPVSTLRKAIEKIIPPPPRPPRMLLVVLALVAIYLGEGIFLQHYCDRSHLKRALVQESFECVYPWINMYLVLDYFPKEKDTVKAIEGVFLDPLIKNNWRLRGTISSESSYLEEKYNVILYLEKASVIQHNTGTTTVLKNLKAKGNAHDLESARRNATESLWQKLLSEMGLE